MRQAKTQTVPLQATCLEPACAGVSDKTTVYFDSACPRCSVEIGHCAALDRNNQVNFVDVSQESANLGEALIFDAARRRFHVRLPDGQLLSGAHAFIAVWRTLPGWRRLARMAALPGVPSLLESLYRVVLLTRPALSKRASVIGARAANPKSGRS